MQSEIPWKSAWVTGAGRGIGEHLSRLLCRHGVTVYGSARSEEQLQALSKELNSAPGQFIPVVMDTRDADSIKAQFERWDSQGILPGLVVLNAGTHDPFSAAEFSAERSKALLDINLQGTINCLAPVLYRYLHCLDSTSRSKSLMPGSKGQIAVVSSVAGYRGLPTAAAYGAGKAALINLCEGLYADLYGSGVKLQLINPGFVRTPLTDKNDFKMPALMEPEDAALRILKGLQTDRFEIVFPRRFVYFLKLLRILPYSWYFKLTRRITGASNDT